MEPQQRAVVEEIGPADVAALALWLRAIPESEWHRLADPDWRGASALYRPVAVDLMRYFPGCRISGLGLFLLAPGQEHPAHRDEQPPEWVTRVHVPVVTNPDATVTTDDGTRHMRYGAAYRFNTRETHAVRNGGTTSRVHLVFDVHAGEK